MNIKKIHLLNTIFPFVICIFLLTFIEFFGLVAVAMIPRKNIQQHTKESADILLEKEVFYYIDEKDLSSQIDRYADSILLNISYSYDANHPLESVMRSSYYYDSTQNENNNLHTAVTNQTAPNKDYLRYWHGSNIIIRPLLLLTNLNGIYIINAITLTLLLICTHILLWKKCSPSSSICMACSCIAVAIWYVPFSLEYTWNFILMFLSCLIACFLYNQKEKTLLLFFFIFGNITAYFDFLSTETITYTMPLIIILLLKHKQNPIHHFKPSLLFVLKTGVLWLLGYALCWLMKWTLASLILDTNAFQLALQQANTRITTQVNNTSLIAQSLGAFARNLSCLFPFSYMGNKAFSSCIIWATGLGILYFLFKKEKQTTLSKVLLIIALLPYIRFLFISNHSYIHYFFTYRAQMASIFAIGLIIIYGIDDALLKKEWEKICKIKKRF